MEHKGKQSNTKDGASSTCCNFIYLVMAYLVHYVQVKTKSVSSWVDDFNLLANHFS